MRWLLWCVAMGVMKRLRKLIPIKKKQLQIPPWFSFVNLERAAKYCEICLAANT